MKATKWVILVGHGGIPTDCPPGLVGDFKRLEASSKGKPSKELLEADARLRNWPRTAKNDPYKLGLESVAESLRRRLPGHRVLEAYNEFCAPSLETAFEEAVEGGAQQVTVISTMFTRGGSHSESEIPAIVSRLEKRYPKILVRNTWPFDLDAVARFMAGEVERVEAETAKA
ncbi:MAG: CbiX/SirB N-terminal domain-containing protein [Elusimicrobia bacterium]|nr:CbiX/SirB N-terminal domain-containing protein [Elusimicrobiota bacterium]